MEKHYDSLTRMYNRLKKKSRGGVINYLKAIEVILEKPRIKLYVSVPESLEKLEKLGKIHIWSNKVFIE
jgi:hypothetical protein